MNIRPLAVVSLGVVANDDGAVGFDQKNRAVGETNARAGVRLRLHRVAREEFSVGARGDGLASGRPDHADVPFKRDEPGAGRVLDFDQTLEGIPVDFDVDCRPYGAAAEEENGDHEI